MMLIYAMIKNSLVEVTTRQKAPPHLNLSHDMMAFVDTMHFG